MSQIKSSLQNACRSVLRPLARTVRHLLTPAAPPIEFDWHEMHAGPAAGTSLLLPKGSAISDLITSGTYEQQVLNIVVSLIRTHDICFDIGGHYGYYTLSLSRLAPMGHVHVFEPVSAHATRIEQGIARSGITNATVHPVAVAGSVGQMTLRFAGTDQGDDSMGYLDAYGGVDTPAAHEHYRSFSSVTVDTVTLDSLAPQLPDPMFIKIDAEGAEGPILQGARELIERSHPRLLVEVHGIYEAMQCAEILGDLDYHAILLTDQKVTMPILWVHQDDQQAFESVRNVMRHDPIVLFDRKRQAGNRVD